MQRRAHVLLVMDGDTQALAGAVERSLDRTTAVTESTAADALDRLGDGGIDCVVTAFELPGEDGLSLVESIRERDLGVPVVLYTDADPADLGERVVTADLAAYVRPGDGAGEGPGALADRVGEALGAEGRGGGRGDPYRTIVEATGAPVYMADADDTITYVNTAAAELTGYGRAELLGEHVSAALDPRDYERVERAVRELVERPDERVETVEMTVDTRDGTRLVVENRVALVPSEESFRGHVGVLRDVTERKARQEELERYETILESVADPVYTLNPEGYITYANEAAIETFGYSEAEFVGAHVSIGMEPEDIRRGQEVIRELIEDEEREQGTIEYEILARDGRRIPVENKIALLPFEDGEFRGTAGVLRNVSDRRRRERRLGVLNRFLRYNVRNEVALMETYAAQLEAQARDEESRDLARELRERARSITKTSHDARRLERAIDRDLDDVTPMDAATLVERVVRRHRERFPGAEVEVDTPGEAMVAADTPLRPALANVVENALVHSDRDRPRVWVSVEPDDRRPEERLAIRVADDGPGIPEDVRQAVLGDVSDTELRAGGGLGLWVATWIVESFGGEVSIEDRDPRGTAVSFYLRRAEE